MIALSPPPLAPLDLDGWSRDHLERVETALSHWVGQGAPAGLGDAMRYAVLDGGKRLRPLLVFAAAEAVQGGTTEHALFASGEVADADTTRRTPTHPLLFDAALRAACAVELIHAYSLVHDDMPCMDNDVLRRGKPTVHVRFGEAQALLAGDALQAFAFELLTPDDADADAGSAHQAMSPRTQATLCRLLARAAGSAGMAGGQAIDLASVGVPLTEGELCEMHRLKTGALLQGSVLMGAVCAPVPPGVYQALSEYGAAVGLAFQVVDDILDVVADSTTLGKTAGKDAAAEKPTYVSLLGLPRAQAYAEDLRMQAHDALARSGLGDTRALAGLADRVVSRSH